MALQRPELTGIPRELLPIITANAPRETIPALSRASRLLKERTDDAYLDQLCREDLELSEINKYLDTLRNRFGVMLPRQFQKIFEINFYSCRPSVRSQYTVDIATYGSMDTPTSGGYGLSYKPVGMFLKRLYLPEIKTDIESSLISQGKDIWSTTQLDMLSLYNILLKRLGCMTRDPGFAKKRAKEVFDLYYNDYKTSLSEPRSISTIRKALCMHAYASMNASTFNIDHYFEKSGVLYEFDERGNITGEVFGVADIDLKETNEWFDRYLSRLLEDIEGVVPEVYKAIDALP